MADSCTSCRAPLEADETLGLCSRCVSNALVAFDPFAKVPPEEATSATATLVADFEVQEILGAGGMASVYRARQVSLNRVVALKVAHPGLGIGTSILERFQIEAETVATLGHPNVVQIFDSGVQDGRPYVAMEYLAGGTLADHFAEFSLAASGLATADFKARIEKTISLMLKITRGIQHAHERGILHRDLKPSNVLLTAAGQPKVGDFGLAKRLGSGQGLTLTNAVLGTPEYMAPEIARLGARAASVACDIYSLGAMLYHLLAGEPPFRSDTVLETMRRTAEEEARPPSLLNARVPVDLAIICLKCIAKDPPRRYESAAALADDLERFLTHRPIIARPVTPAEKLVLWCKRHPRRAAGLAALVILLLAGIGGVTWQWLQTLRANHALVLSETKLSRELRLATTLRLASQAGAELAESPPRALLLAAAAVELGRGTEAGFAANASLIATLNEVGGESILVADPKASRACLSPDGRWLARLDDQGRACMRELAGQGREQHWAAQTGAGLEPGWVDRATLCTAGTNGDLKLWRLGEEGNPGPIAATNAGETVIQMVVAPKAGRVFTLGKTGVLRSWPVSTTGFGEPVMLGQFSRPEHLWSNLSGTRFVVTHAGRLATLAALELTNGSPPTLTQVSLRREVTQAQFSPDGRWVATGGLDDEAWLYDLSAEGDAPAGFAFGKMTSNIRGLAFSPDSQWVACVGNGELMMLCKTKPPGPAATASAIPVRIGGYRNYAVAFSPDSTTVYTGGEDHLIYRFDLNSLLAAPAVAVLRGFETPVREILVVPGGDLLAGIDLAGSGRQWHLDRPAGTAIAASRVVPKDMRDLQYSPDGAWLVAAIDDGNIYGWRNKTDMSHPLILSGHAAQVCSVAFEPGGKWLVSASYDGTARWWDWQARVEGRTNLSDRILFQLPGPGSMRAVAVNPRNSSVAGGGTGGYVEIITTNAAATVQTFQIAGVTEVRTLNFSSDGRWLAIGGLADRGSVLEIRDFRSHATVPVRRITVAGSVQTVTFSRDDRWLAEGGDDRTVRLWDLDNTNTAAPPELAPFTTGAIGKLRFAPDGQTLAIAQWDSTVRLWQFLDPAAESSIFHLAWAARACAFSPDGSRLAAGGHDGRVTVWDLDPTVLLARARELAGRDLTAAECARFGIGAGGKVILEP